MAARATVTPRKSDNKPVINHEEQVRIRAYEIYLQRNAHAQEGSDVEDWLQAEAELRGPEEK